MAIKTQETYPNISIVMVVTILIMAIALPGLEAQSPASAPMPEMDPCMTALLNMSDCLSYVTSGSNETKPDKACCPELAGLVESNPICLCQLLGKPDTLGISIDLNRALQLPSACKVDTPPVSTCAVLGIPVAAPSSNSPTTSSPADAVANSPHSSPTGDIVPGGAAATPSSTGGNNGSNSSSSAITSLHCFLALAIIMLFSNLF